MIRIICFNNRRICFRNLNIFNYYFVYHIIVFEHLISTDYNFYKKRNISEKKTTSYDM